MTGLEIGILAQRREVSHFLEFQGDDDFCDGISFVSTDSYTMCFDFFVNSYDKVIVTDYPSLLNFIQIKSSSIRVLAGGVDADISVGALTAGQWYRAIFSCNSGALTIYLNGVAGITKPSSSLNIERLGGYDFAGFDFDGGIDNFVIQSGFVANAIDASDINLSSTPWDEFPNPDKIFKFNQFDGETILLNDGASVGDGELNNFTVPYFVER